MIKLSNDHCFEYMVASGALGFDGKGWLWERPLVKLGLIQPELFTIVLKTLTRYRCRGNLRWWKPWTCVRLIAGGSVNKVGLTNPGIEHWCKKTAPRLNFQEASLVGSIFGEEKELIQMAHMLNKFNFVAIELNISCPNTDDPFKTAETVIKAVKAVKAVSHHPLIVKISVSQDYISIVQGLQGIVEAVSINSVPWEKAFPNGERSPLWKLEKKVKGGGGGVSGKPAQKLNWAAVKTLAKQTSVPVIAPSIMEFNDLARVKILDAKAASFGAIHLRTPWKPTFIIIKKKAHDRKHVNYSPVV